MAKAVKLADIAERLGVSTVTVSKALADQKGVSEEMREKIKQLADDLGYISPSASRKLKEQKSYNIGVIIAEQFFRYRRILLFPDVPDGDEKRQFSRDVLPCWRLSASRMKKI